MPCDHLTTSRIRRVLVLLGEAPSAWHFGYGISRRTGLRAGMLYPVLACMAEQQWIEVRWVQPAKRGHRNRHAYRLTDEGIASAVRAESACRRAVTR